MDEQKEFSDDLKKLADLMDKSFNYQLGFQDMDCMELLQFTGDFLFGNTEYKCENENADIIQIKEIWKRIFRGVC